MYALLDFIRRRPGMYIGNPSPTHLHSFLSGYSYAEFVEGKKGRASEFDEFHDWIAHRLDYAESTSGWANMIEDQRLDKEKSVGRK